MKLQLLQKLTMGFVPWTSRYNSKCSFVGKGLKFIELHSPDSRSCINSLAYSAMDYQKEIVGIVQCACCQPHTIKLHQ